MDTSKHAPIEITSAPAGEEVETLVLFTLDGVEYRIPAKPRMNLALQLLDDIEEVGAGLANMRLLRKLIGEDGYQALAHHDGLTREHLAQVSQAASSLTLGALEDASGN